MIRAALAAIALAASLGGCAIVTVHAQGGRPHIGFYPFGVRIERGSADALTVAYTNVGLMDGCGFVGLGATHINCTVIDPQTCGVAVIEKPAKRAKGPLAKVSDQVRAWCLRGKEEAEK